MHIFFSGDTVGLGRVGWAGRVGRVVRLRWRYVMAVMCRDGRGCIFYYRPASGLHLKGKVCLVLLQDYHYGVIIDICVDKY